MGQIAVQIPGQMQLLSQFSNECDSRWDERSLYGFQFRCGLSQFSNECDSRWDRLAPAIVTGFCDCLNSLTSAIQGGTKENDELAALETVSQFSNECDSRWDLCIILQLLILVKMSQFSNECDSRWDRFEPVSYYRLVIMSQFSNECDSRWDLERVVSPHEGSECLNSLTSAIQGGTRGL